MVRQEGVTEGGCLKIYPCPPHLHRTSPLHLIWKQSLSRLPLDLNRSTSMEGIQNIRAAIRMLGRRTQYDQFRDQTVPGHNHFHVLLVLTPRRPLQPPRDQVPDLAPRSLTPHDQTPAGATARDSTPRGTLLQLPHTRMTETQVIIAQQLVPTFTRVSSLLHTGTHQWWQLGERGRGRGRGRGR